MPMCPPRRSFYETFKSRKFTFNRWVNAEDDADGSVLAEFKGEDKLANGAHFEVLFTISTAADTKDKLQRNLSQAFKDATVSVLSSKLTPFHVCPCFLRVSCFPQHSTDFHGFPRISTESASTS